MDIDRIYENLAIDGFDISRQYRALKKSEGKFDEAVSLQYGEVDISDFMNYLESEIPSKTDGSTERVFVDIGCGTGKPVFAAAASGCGFSTAIGIEIVPSLIDKAKAVQAQYTPSTDDCSITFLQGDCFSWDTHWKEADVLFLPITCFTNEMVEQCADKIVSLVNTAYIITTSTIEDLTALCDCRPRLKRVGKPVRLKYGKGTMEFSLFYKGTSKEEGKEGKEKDGNQNENGKRQQCDTDKKSKKKKT